MTLIKEVYRYMRWKLVDFMSNGRASKLVNINPFDISIGQKPDSQFHARKTTQFVKQGGWDKEVLNVEEHLLFISYLKHFKEGEAWVNTPVYKKAKKLIEGGAIYRGEYGNIESLNKRFKKCDQLYQQIKLNGYKSNATLYNEKKIDNVLALLDEVTVNISRDGSYILNDGWHRFSTARMLGITSIPVRVLVRHSEAPN